MDSNHRPHPYQRDVLIRRKVILRPFNEYGKSSPPILPQFFMKLAILLKALGFFSYLLPLLNEGKVLAPCLICGE